LIAERKVATGQLAGVLDQFTGPGEPGQDRLGNFRWIIGGGENGRVMGGQ
jgi:hypothetical protein